MAVVSVAMPRSRFAIFLVCFSLLSLGASGQNYSVTVEADPVLASYTVGSNVTLQCVVDPVITDTSVTPMYSWQCDPGCFVDGMTTRNITRQLTDTDSGLIDCSVTIDGDEYTSDSMFDLQVSQAPTPIITFNPPSPITGVMVGSPQDIDCIVNTTVPGVSSVSVSWTGPGGVPILSNTNRVTISPPTSSGNIFTSSLQFTYLTEDDEGTYTCNVMILDASATQSIELQSLTVPTPVVRISTPVTQMVGDPLTLQCNGTTVRGITSRVDIVWSNGGTVLRRMNGTTPTTIGSSLVYTDSLNIPPLSTTADGRVIQCEVVINTSPSVMATDRITLDVTVPTPTVTISPSSPINGADMVGSPQVINCTVSTISGVESSSVMISWMGPGGNIDTTNGRMSIGSVTDDGNNTYTRSLQFTYLMEGDEGNYTCNVTILDASVTQSIELQSLTVPTPIVSIAPPVNQTVGQSLTLQCEVTTVRGITSRVDIVWSNVNDSTELNRTVGITLNTIGDSQMYTHSYTIPQLSTADDGTVIQCEVGINTSPSVMDTDSITLDVTVPTPTVIISPSSPIQGAMVGSSQVINCTVSTVSGVESSSVMISWMGPGGNIDATNGRVSIGSVTDDGNNMYTRSLQFTYLTEDDENTYNCDVMILKTGVSQMVNLQPLTIPTPTVSVTTLNNQTVGNPLELQCEVTTVRGITSRVDIVWRSNGTEPEGMNVSSTTINNSIVYTGSYTISLLSTTDNGRVIQCEVVINASPPVTATDSITLDVMAPTFMATTALEPINSQPTVGRTEDIVCTVSGISGVEPSALMISWLGPGRNIITNDSDSRLSIIPTTFSGNTYISRLLFEYLVEDDEGNYTCNVAILDDSTSSVFRLQSFFVMEPEVTLRNLTTPTLNEQLTLQCEAAVTRGVTSPVDIIWSRNNGTEILQRVDGANSTLRDNMLVFTDTYTTPVLTEDDNGMMYACTVSINTTSDRRSGNNFFILALHIPTTVSVTAPDTQLVGQSLTLQCEVTTVSNIISSVDIVWSSGGMELNRTNNLTAAIMNDIVVYSDSYTTDPLNSNDNGSTIQCQVIINTTTNADTVELTLSVPDPTVVVSPLMPLEDAMVGDHLRIICIVTANVGVELQSVIIVWSGPPGEGSEGPIDSVLGGRVTFTDVKDLGGNNFTSTLNISYVMEGDEGTYTCDVMILNATGTDSIEILNLSIPSPDIIITAGGNHTVGNELILQCDVSVVRGVTSSVDMMWRDSNLTVLERTDDITLTLMGNSQVYTDSYTISQLSTTDNGREIQCEVVINANPPVLLNNSITLNITVPQATISVSQSSEGSVSGLYHTLTCIATVVNGVSPSLVMVSWDREETATMISNDTMPISDGLQFTRIISYSPIDTSRRGPHTCSVLVDGFSEADNSADLTVVVSGPNMTVIVDPPVINGNATEVPIRLTCIATVEENITSDEYQVIWMLNGVPIEQPNERIMITTMESNMESSAMGSNMESSATIGSNVESELYIGLNNTIAEDSGIYTCQVILTINGIDTFTASDTSTILIRAMQRPLTPIVRDAITTPTSVNISWTVQSIVNDMEEYVVRYGTNNVTLTNTSEVIMGNSDLNTLNQLFSVYIVGLTPFTTYYYIISATNTAGTTNTTVMNFTTNETAPNTFPQNFRNVTVTTTSITFQWDPLPVQESNGIIRSYIINCIDSDSSSFTRSFANAPGTVDGLSPFTEYTCTISASTVSPGPVSDPITVRTAQSDPSAPVINSVVNNSVNSVLVNWSRPAMPNGIITNYNITYIIDGSSESSSVNVNYNGQETQSYEITGLSPYQLVRVTITATNGGGTSDPSNTVSGRSSEAEPGIVAKLTVSNITVTWGPPERPNGVITDYEVIYFEYDKDTQAQEVRLDPSQTMLTHAMSNLTDGVPYQLVVVAYTSAGSGQRSNRSETLFAKQLAPNHTIEEVTIKRLSPTSINVSWIPLTLRQARGFPIYRVVLTLSGSRMKRQFTQLTMNTTSSFYVFMGLDRNSNYDVVVGVRSERAPGGVYNETVPILVLSDPEPTAAAEDENIGGIIGGVIAAVVAVLIVVLIIIVLITIRNRKKKSYSVVAEGPESSAAFINKRIVSPSESVTGEQQNTIAMQTIDPKIEQRLEPISIKDFSEHVKNMHRDRDLGFEEEYSTISTEALASYDASQESANVIKNRYANIFPYDFARVKVTRVDMKDDDTDYINASHIDGYSKTGAYIAAQGPLPETVKDFWQMVWDQKSTVIVMVTKTVEADIQKCEQYWPECVDETITPKPSLAVKLTQIQHFADYELRTMTVTKVSEDEKDDTIPLEVKHFFFTSWPDHGVPQFATALITFIKRVRQSQPKDGESPLIVHCSAGVGRTGTYITLDTMLERMMHVDNVNVYECVRNLRAKRVLMVQTQAQYIFIHDALEELITCGDTSFNVQSMRVKVNRMAKVNPETEITGFQEQFELLEKVCRKPTLNDCADSQRESNTAKNRFENIMPYDATRVVLKAPPSAMPGTDYINASRIDGYKERNAFIATQCPLEKTVGDFWRMIWENKSGVIVLLCDPEHDEKDFTKFWPDENEEHGQITVTQKSHSEKTGYMAYKFSVMGPSTAVGVEPEPLQVTMLHYTNWPNNAKPSNNAGLLALTKDALELQRNTGNRAMTVVCSDGCGRSGTFIAIYYTIERLKVDGTVDIFQAIKNCRLNRSNLVSNTEQYQSCHEVVLEFLDEFEAYANFK